MFSGTLPPGLITSTKYLLNGLTINFYLKVSTFEVFALIVPIDSDPPEHQPDRIDYLLGK